MKGLPSQCKTRDDWVNAAAYSVGKSGPAAEMIRRLRELKGGGTMMVLSAGAPEDPEEQTPDHFESVYDPASPVARSGLSGGDIDAMIEKLGGAA